MDYDYDFIIVGCGVFGLSTALELTKTNCKILALDAYPVPSEYSAANDFNKIIRIEYSDEVSAKLAVEALQYWENDPLYTKNYRKTGRLTLTPGDPTSDRSEYERKSFEILSKLGVNQKMVKINKASDVGKYIKEFANNNLPQDIISTYNYECGTGLSGKALVSVYEAAKAKGVNFKFGDDGRVTSVGDNHIRVKSGKKFSAGKVIVTAGAGTGLIVPLDNQTKVFGTFVTHIQLNDEEYERYKNIPIFFSAQYGYFFPPDEDLHQIKIGVTTCDAYGEINHPFEAGKTLRAPRYSVDHPEEVLPEKHYKDIKTLLHLVVPDLANHKLVGNKTCWIADSCDSYFLIDNCPYYKDVLVATGDSSHSFKFLPTIGKYITQKLNGSLDKKLDSLWSWKVNPSFASGKNAKSRLPRPHYNTELIPKL
ncbi:putative L-saccharopine oxidase [[Candida] jaroonii]|uniref:L-saccharopine oxidase n=1 Tax=[Candida] jaroonii TaxID=467808 RepID=A0ACA9YDR3_9ASCO|nr:putative L-saccharopine oxidase [[Candida] jaroonii]